MNNTYTENVTNLLNSIIQNVETSESGVILIKHYNSIDLNQEMVEKCFADKKGIRYVYHKFDSETMAEPYEPFLLFMRYW